VVANPFHASACGRRGMIHLVAVPEDQPNRPEWLRAGIERIWENHLTARRTKKPVATGSMRMLCGKTHGGR